LVTKLPSPEDLLDGPIVGPDDPALGQAGAPVTIVYFSDFSCDFCQQQEQIIKQIISQYQDAILLVWKDYPEAKPLSYSFQAAQAARCAQEQNKFWAYHDQLFLNKNKFNRDKFIALAEQLKLNQDRFTDCLDSGRTKQQVLNNIEEANLLQISGIPFTYVNKQELLGQASLEELRQMVKAELDKAGPAAAAD
jgi:protein-disulfide isomerase